MSDLGGILDYIALKSLMLSIFRLVSQSVSWVASGFWDRWEFTGKGILGVVNAEGFLSEASSRLPSKLSPKFNGSIVSSRAIYK